MKRTLVLSSIVIVAVVAVAGRALVAQQQPAGPKVAAIEKVKDNLYMVTGGGGNTAVFVTANGVVLVDTKLADWGQPIMDQVKTVTDKPVTHIINTHTHGDHVGSNDFFPASVEIVAHANVTTSMQKMPQFADPAKKHAFPDKTYTDKLTVLGGNEAIDLYHFGPAHTNGDTFVVFRALQVMHAGDVFPMKGTPFIDRNNGGNGVTYPETIAKAAAGHQGRRHGDPGPQRGDDLGRVRRVRRVQQGLPDRHAGGEEGRQDRRAGRRRDQAAGEVQGLQRRPRQGERRSDLRGPALVFGDFGFPPRGTARGGAPSSAVDLG